VGVFAVSEDADLTLTLVPGVPPNETVAPDAKLVPLIVTIVPWAVVPDVGLRLLIVGGAT
jgi:hypothetical protein